MIVYDGLKKDFIDDVTDDVIAKKIEDKILEKMGRHTPKSEFDSWIHSLNYMYKVINDKDIPDDCGIAIEYNIPYSAKRVDFMISGYDENNKSNVVIVELKQWQKLDKVDSMDGLVETYVGHSLRTVVHPSYQAWSYASFIKDYNEEVFSGDIKLNPCAYLHNYERRDNDPLDDACYKEYLDAAPAYTFGQTRDLREFVKRFVKKGDNKQILYCIDNGKIKPSKSLQDSINSMIEGNKEFIMIDEQKVVYEKILEISNKCQKDNKKRTIICKGGPGTGKSVIAIRALSELTKQDQVVQYVSKNSAPRQVYLNKLKGNKRLSGVDNMFKGSGQYVNVKNNSIGTVLVDEAHRLNEKSGMFQNLGENQIKELISASLCSVFFIDENQRVTTKDIGSVDEIKYWADKEDSEVIELELVSQFRCNGSNGYLAFIDNILEIRETANYDLDGLDYDFKVYDNPNDLRQAIIEKNKETNKARILAGYCWLWPSKNRRDTNYHDIKIGDFEMSWNLDGGQAYAIDENSINEVGCIHTTQGLEFDYVGVIIGDDLRYENDKLVTDFTKRASSDQSIKGLKTLYKEDKEKALKLADEIIKNTYRTLLTRGMKGCYVYCTDKNLNNYFKGRLLAKDM